MDKKVAFLTTYKKDNSTAVVVVSATEELLRVKLEKK